MVTNEICGTATSAPKNLGGKNQCLEGPVKTIFLAKEGFSFATVAASKTEAAWLTAIEAKDVVPFPLVEGIEPNNTEAAIKNGRFKDYTLKAAVPGSTYRFDLSICTFEAVKTYENSDYTRVFQATAGDEFTCDIQSDGTVKGRDLASFLVGSRNEATDADVPFVNIGLKYNSDVYSILKAGFDVSDLEGIHDVVIEQVSASATVIKVKVLANCSGTLVTSLAAADFIVKDLTGATETVSFTAADSDGVYTLTGTGFETGYTVELDGVVAQTGIMYEDVEPLSITVT